MRDPMPVTHEESGEEAGRALLVGFRTRQIEAAIFFEVAGELLIELAADLKDPEGTGETRTALMAASSRYFNLGCEALRDAGRDMAPREGESVQ